MAALHGGERLFVTVEPILECDIRVLVHWIKHIYPEFVNIGADSKGTGMKEPTGHQVEFLIDCLNLIEVEIRQKSNLDRLLRKGAVEA